MPCFRSSAILEHPPRFGMCECGEKLISSLRCARVAPSATLRKSIFQHFHTSAKRYGCFRIAKNSNKTNFYAKTRPVRHSKSRPKRGCCSRIGYGDDWSQNAIFCHFLGSNDVHFSSEDEEADDENELRHLKNDEESNDRSEHSLLSDTENLLTDSETGNERIIRRDSGSSLNSAGERNSSSQTRLLHDAVSD